MKISKYDSSLMQQKMYYNLQICTHDLVSRLYPYHTLSHTYKIRKSIVSCFLSAKIVRDTVIDEMEANLSLRIEGMQAALLLPIEDDN